MSEHAAATMSTDLFAYCPTCDPQMDEGLVLYGFDEVGCFECPTCKKAMTAYGVSFFEVHPHGTNCPDCVALGPAERRSGSFALTAEQFGALNDLRQLKALTEQHLAGATA